MPLASWLPTLNSGFSLQFTNWIISQLQWQEHSYSASLVWEGLGVLSAVSLTTWLVAQRPIARQTTQTPRSQLPVPTEPVPTEPLLTGMMWCHIYPDNTWEILSMSKECAAIFGYSVKDFMTHPDLWRSQIDSVTWDTLFHPLTPQLATAISYEVEYQFQRSNHQFCWLKTQVIAHPSEAQQGWMVTLIHTPIPDRPSAPAAPPPPQNSLHQELAFRNQILDQMAEGLCVCHRIPDFPYVYFTVWSQRMVDLTGYTQTQINELGWYQTLYPDSAKQAQAIARMEAMRQGHNLQSEEWEIIHADGHKRVLSISTSLIDHGQPEPHVLALMRDITAAKAVESAYRISENKTRALIQALPDLILRMDRQGVYLGFFPTSTFTVLGGEFLIGKDIYEGHLPAAIADQRIHYIHKALDTGKLQVYEQEFFIEDQLKIEEVRIVVCGVDEVLVIVRDMTQRKRIEADLQASEERLRAILNSSPYGIFLKDMEGRYTYVNPACEILSQLSHTQLLGQRDEDVLPPDLITVCSTSDQAAIATGQAVTVEETVPLGGQMRTLLMTKFLLHDCGDRPYALCGILLDITERKRTEAALRENEQFLRSIYNYAQNSIFVVDVQPNHEFRYVNLNPIHTQLTGLSIEQIQGKTPADILPPAVAATVQHHYQRCVESKAVVIYEEFLPFQGRELWWLTSLAPIADEHGRVYRLVGTSTDISQLKIAEQQLQNRADREIILNRVVQTIRCSLDLAQVFEVTVTEVANFLAVDQVSIFQYCATEALWRCRADFVPALGTPKSLGLEIADIDNPLAARLRQGQLVHIEDTATLADEVNQPIAELHPGAWLLVPLQANGAVWGSLTLIRHQRSAAWDTTEMELAAAIADQLAIAIQQSILYQQLQNLNCTLDQQVQERTVQLQQALDFDATLKRITDAVRDSLDETQIIQTVVEELVAILGIHRCDIGLYNKSEQTSTISYECSKAQTAVAQPASSVTLCMKQFPQEYTQLLAGVHFQLCKHHCEHQWETAFACPIVDDQDVLGDLWLFKPATDIFTVQEVRLIQQVANQCAIALRQSRLYQAAQTQVIELERLNQLKDDFLSTVSHELRTPMSNIKMATQMIEITLKNLEISTSTGNLAQYFQILRDEGQRELDLINDLLDLTRLDAEIDTLMPTTIALQNWLPHVAEPFRAALTLQNQTLQVDVAPDLAPITTDLSYLERILTELLNNACKYTPPGEQIQLAARSHLPPAIATDQSPWYKITVANTGIEIPPQERDRVFERFYRIPNSDPWRHSGTGLGLALVKQLVQFLGGTITLHSHGNQTQFHLLLPDSPPQP